jgi:hypothetical protein
MTDDRSHELLPVRKPGGSVLPPTSPRMLGRWGRPSAPVMPDERAGRPGMDVLRRSLGRRLTVWRVAVGLSQRQLASRIGFSQLTVAGVESGNRRAARDFWVRCDSAPGAGGALIASYRRVVVAQEQEFRERADKAEAEREVRR